MGPGRCATAWAPRRCGCSSAPHRGQAAILEGGETLDARVAAALRRALDELVALAGQDAALWPGPATLADTLAARRGPRGRPLGARRGRRDEPAGAPGAPRARAGRRAAAGGRPSRRRRAPSRSWGTPTAARSTRPRACACASTRTRWTASAALFYAAVSRPTEQLALGWHVADDDGAPRVPSLLLSDVRDLFAPSLWEPAPPPRARRGRAAPPRRPGRSARWARSRARRSLAALAARPARLGLGAGGVGGLPRALVRRALPGPGALEADPEPLRAGRPGARRPGGGPAHRLGRRPPDPGAAARGARGRWGACWAAAPTTRSRRTPTGSRAILRRLESDVWRELERHAHDGGRLRPDALRADVRRGGRRPPARSSSPAASSCSQGRVDRVDLSPDGRRALVVDYKGRSGAAPQERWRADRRLQVGLYLLAPRPPARRRAAGRRSTSRWAARTPSRAGLLRDDADDGLTAKRPDRVDEEGFAAVLADVEAAAVQAAAELRAGRLEGRPATCAYRGRLRAPVDLPVRGARDHRRRCPVPPSAPSRTPRSTAATGPLLLAANAGSGKTSVLVERFVRDGGRRRARRRAGSWRSRSPSKAAGELRDRDPRRASLERGLRDAARDAEGAWISTIHGFCARVLRAHAVAAGLDPGFARPRRAGRAGAARARPSTSRWPAGSAATDRRRRARSTSPPPTAPTGWASSWARSTTSCAARAARSRCRARPRPTSPPRPRWLGAPPRARRLALAGATRPLSSLDKALARRARLPGDARGGRRPGRPPAAAACAALVVRRRARAGAAGRARRGLPRGLRAPTRAPATTPPRRRSSPAWTTSCAPSPTPTPPPSGRGRPSTSPTSSSSPATCCATSPRSRAALRERFARVMVDEFQDTNPLQLELLELLGVDATFVVGRRAAVDLRLPPRRRRGLPPPPRAAGRARRRRPSWPRASGRGPTSSATLDRPSVPATADGLRPARRGPRRAAGPGGARRAAAHRRDRLGRGGERHDDPARGAAGLRPPGAGLDADGLARGRGAPGRPARRARSSTPGSAGRARSSSSLRALRATGADRARAAGPRPRDARGRRPRLVGAASRSATSSRGSRRWPTRATRRRSSACWPRRCAARAATRWRCWRSRARRRRRGALGPPGGRVRGGRPARAAGAAGAATTTRAWRACVARLAAERAVAPRHGLDELLDRVVRATRLRRAPAALRGGARRLANVRKLQRLAARLRGARGARRARASSTSRWPSSRPTRSRPTRPSRSRARTRCGS